MKKKEQKKNFFFHLPMNKLETKLKNDEESQFFSFRLPLPFLKKKIVKVSEKNVRSEKKNAIINDKQS